MKKAVAFISGLSLFIASAAFAQSPTANSINVAITPPAQGLNPSTPIGAVLSNALTIIFVIAAIAVLFMLLWGGFMWITSGGDKEGVDKARKRITHALVGLAILAFAFLLVRIIGQILSIDILKLQNLPSLSTNCTQGQAFDPTAGSCRCPAGTGFNRLTPTPQQTCGTCPTGTPDPVTQICPNP